LTLLIIIRLIYEAYFRFPHFRVRNVCMRQWINRSAEQLITYQIELRTKKSSRELVFEELWIDEKKYKFNISRDDKKIVAEFDEKETIKLNVLSEIKTYPVPNIHSSRGIMVLGYSFRKKKRYITFNKISLFDFSRLLPGL
jgi:hypothetical protein